MISIKTPFIKYANDYHDFINLQDDLLAISGQFLSFTEFSPAEFSPANTRVGTYGAVFYLKGEGEEAETLMQSKMRK